MEYIIDVENFKFSYGDKVILENVNFHVKQGEIIGLLGENGAGKTTLIDCLYGFHGEIETIKILSHVPDLNDTLMKKNISYIQDTPNMLDYLTAKQYLNFICNIEKEDKKEKSEEIESFIKLFHLEESYSTKLMKDYSFGMKKKIQFISEIFLHKKLLMIDEPTNGLDISMIILLKETLRNENKKYHTTMLISSHNTQFLQDVCNRVLVFDDKQLVKDILISKQIDLESEFLRIKNHEETD